MEKERLEVKNINWFLNIRGEDVVCEDTIYAKFDSNLKDGERVLDKNKNKKYKDYKNIEVRPVELSLSDIKEIIIDGFNHGMYRSPTFISFEKDKKIYEMYCSNTIAADIDIMNFYSNIVKHVPEGKFSIKLDNLSDGFEKSLTFIKDRNFNQLQIGVRENPTVKDFLEVPNLEELSTDMLYLANGTLWAYLGVGVRHKFGYLTDKATKKKNLIIKSSEERPILVNLEVLGNTRTYATPYLDDISNITKVCSIEEFRKQLNDSRVYGRGENQTWVPTQVFAWKDSFLSLIKEDNWNLKRLNEIYLEQLKSILEETIFRRESYITNRKDAINFSNFWLNSTQKVSWLNEVQKMLNSVIIPMGNTVNSTDDLLRVFNIEMNKLYFLDNIDLFKAGDWFLNNGALYYIVKTAKELKYTVNTDSYSTTTTLKNKKDISEDNLLVIKVSNHGSIDLKLEFITKKHYSYMYRANVPQTLFNHFKTHSVEELSKRYQSIEMDNDKDGYYSFTPLMNENVISQFEEGIMRAQMAIDNGSLKLNGAISPNIFTQLAAMEKLHPLLESIEDFDDFMLNVEDFICERREG